AAGLGLLGVATASGMLSATPAGATSASAAITAGSLAFVSTPASVGFSVTLNGTDQTPTAVSTFDIGDATGSGAGWNLTAASTTFRLSVPANTFAGTYTSTWTYSLVSAP